MKTKEELLSDLKKKYKEYDDKFSILSRESRTIEQEIEKLSSDIILENKYLSKESWTLSIGRSKKDFYLTSHLKNRKNFHEILKLSSGPYHHSISINEVTLSFNDNDVYLYFKSSKQGLEFIKEQGIKPNITTLKKDFDELESSLISIKTILEMFSENN